MGLMMMISHAEEDYKKTSGSYGTMDQLIAAKLLSKEMFESAGYKFEIFVTGDKFEAFAVPIEYGKNGKMSYFVDQTRVLRGADHNGASANSSDPPILVIISHKEHKSLLVAYCEFICAFCGYLRFSISTGSTGSASSKLKIRE